METHLGSALSTRPGEAQLAVLPFPPSAPRSPTLTGSRRRSQSPQAAHRALVLLRSPPRLPSTATDDRQHLAQAQSALFPELRGRERRVGDARARAADVSLFPQPSRSRSLSNSAVVEDCGKGVGGAVTSQASKRMRPHWVSQTLPIQRDCYVSLPRSIPIQKHPEMLLQRGFMGLPSWSGHRHSQHGAIEMGDSEMKRKEKSRGLPPNLPFPSKVVVNGTPSSLKFTSSRNPMHGYSWCFRQSRCPQRAQSTSPLFGIHSKDSGIDLINDAEDHRQLLSRSVRRRHSLSRFPNGDARKHSPLQPLARRRWSGSGPDLRRPFREEGQRESEMGAALWSRERNLEVELNMMQFELFSLKQKMENSLAHLEKEKKWLETSFLENRKQEGDLDEKILNVEMELEKTKTYLGQRNQKSLPEASTESSHNGVATVTAAKHRLRTWTASITIGGKE
ncbi:uncharacterized protein [Anolis sagrei]|uniref:uncharacterized protein n=1 Tax=Anolis sagrei TaxID=38937 RepID=UPI00352130D5